jgi:hypothetical protein
MGLVFTKAKANFLSINTTSHDGIAEGDKRGKLEYVGGAYSKFEECVPDIEAAVTFARQFSDRIVLQGHSFGCDRVVHYLTATRAKHDCILLSPCDSYQLQCAWISPETVESQIARLKQALPSDPVFDWVPSREYGVKGLGDWTYSIPITRPALLSIMEGPPYQLFRVSKPAKFFLKQRALVCIGGRDALQSWPQDVMFNYLRERINDVTALYLPDADHMIAKHERHVATKIADWLGLRPAK